MRGRCGEISGRPGGRRRRGPTGSAGRPGSAGARAGRTTAVRPRSAPVSVPCPVSVPSCRGAASGRSVGRGPLDSDSGVPDGSGGARRAWRGGRWVKSSAGVRTKACGPAVAGRRRRLGEVERAGQALRAGAEPARTRRPGATTVRLVVGQDASPALVVAGRPVGAAALVRGPGGGAGGERRRLDRPATPASAQLGRARAGRAHPGQRPVQQGADRGQLLGDLVLQHPQLLQLAVRLGHARGGLVADELGLGAGLRQQRRGPPARRSRGCGWPRCGPGSPWR